MLECSLRIFRSGDRKLLAEVEQLDGQVDRLNEAIKMHLTRVGREGRILPTSAGSSISSHLRPTPEHVGDIVDKSLMDLAAKKIKHGLKFSTEGAREIEEIHHRLNGNVALAMNVFMTGDLTLARQLFAEKQAFRELEREAAEGHIARLREGRIESIGTSGLHLDILRDLKRINSHLALVGQPILEAAGELRASRLKEDP
jgi:phosphate:Na+ symporter